MMSASHSNSGWFLEGFVDDARVARRFVLRTFPVRIGRSPDADISLPVAQVSGWHAEIALRDGELWLSDLDSSNGTFVNRQPVDHPVALRHGDVVNFGPVELLAACDNAQEEQLKTCIMSAAPLSMASGTLGAAQALRELIAASQVAAVFQPIVAIDGSAHHAFELLGRGASDELPKSPGALFRIAEQAGLAAALSRTFRDVGVSAAAGIPGAPRIYINIHPEELAAGDLHGELAALRSRFPKLPVTVEVHESTVTDPATLAELRAMLQDFDIDLAYDDFGAGQARLLELADCPPDCLKFDMSLIRDIDTAPEQRQRMVETLVQMATDMGVVCLAEGIERQGELDACRAMGFELAQGYFIARPAAADAWQAGGCSLPGVGETCEDGDEDRTVVEPRRVERATV
ncbi:MAG: EAL domain-containing protein [Gammaproteobacteria bacterium]|nr:EAL domain-containing protein [Gammaproteobacteria bacterium]